MRSRGMIDDVTDRPSLESAYLATSYCICTPSGEHCLRIGVRHPELDRMLKNARAREWAIVTADNPRSRQVPDAENRLAREHLAETVRRAGYESLPAIARSDAGDWPAEHGLFILAIPRHAASALAREFDQNAFVHGTVPGVAELLFCDANAPDQSSPNI